MLDAAASDFPESKVNRLVENVAAIWEQSKDKRGTQMIFADMGVNPTKWGYSPYDDIIQKLVTYGIPRDQIATMGDAESDAKKQALFEKVRNGSVRVLIGSTQKMGTGTNVQKRLVALHHLDAPWKPAEVEQRDGRILRQGNENDEVSIYRYVTEGSFDAYMWQALETKARFIGQVITGNNTARRADDIGGQELSYAEVKAIASGNPAVLTLAEADAELQRLSLLKKNHLDEQYVARRSVQDLPKTIAGLSERVANLTADKATAGEHADDPVIIGERKCLPDEVLAVLEKRLDDLPLTVRQPTRVPLGMYRGLSFGVVVRDLKPLEVYVEGTATRQTSLSREHQGPRAVLNAVERLVEGYGPEADRTRQDLTIAESQLRDYQARLGAPFHHDGYHSELTVLRDQLKAGLSGRTPEPDSESPLTLSELASRFKALKGTHTIDATPQRTERHHSDAEEPVTARIRRRAAENAQVTDESDAPTAAESPSVPEPTARELFVDSEFRHADRVATEHHRHNGRRSISD